MCKIMILPKVTNTNLAMELLKASAPYMTENDKDGLGYTALLESGEMVGERWLNTNDAFGTISASDSETKSLTPIMDVISGFSTGSGYNSFGPIGSKERVTSIIYHSRMATSEKGMANVHPFNDKALTTSIIHNGVISNPDVFGKRATTCDSEAILLGYLANDIVNKATGIQNLVNSLEGWFACGVIAQNKHGGWYLDVFKDDNSNLDCVYVPKLDAHVFCTRASIIDQACADLGWELGNSYSVNENIMIRYDALSGDVIDTWEFNRPYKALSAKPSSRDYSRGSYWDRFDNYRPEYKNYNTLDEYESVLDAEFEAAMDKEDFEEREANVKYKLRKRG